MRLELEQVVTWLHSLVFGFLPAELNNHNTSPVHRILPNNLPLIFLKRIFTVRSVAGLDVRPTHAPW